MNSSRINSHTFESAVAELTAQSETPDGRWLGMDVIFPIAEEIVRRIDGTSSVDRASDLCATIVLKSVWRCLDRYPTRNFDTLVAELAAYAPSRTPEQIHAFATTLVERGDGTEFADLYRVQSLTKAAKLKNAWTPRPDLGNAIDPSELEQDFIDIFTEAAAGHVWLRAMVSTPDRFLNAVEVSAGHDRAVLESLISMSESERREWLDACIDREVENYRREGRDSRAFVFNDATTLSGSHDRHGNLHTCMLPMAAKVLLAYRHAPAPPQLALAA